MIMKKAKFEPVKLLPVKFMEKGELQTIERGEDSLVLYCVTEDSNGTYHLKKMVERAKHTYNTSYDDSFPFVFYNTKVNPMDLPQIKRLAQNSDFATTGHCEAVYCTVRAEDAERLQALSVLLAEKDEVTDDLLVVSADARKASAIMGIAGGTFEATEQQYAEIHRAIDTNPVSDEPAQTPV